MRCVLPDSYPEISFDAFGICRFCRNHHKLELPGEQALLKKVSRHRGSDYDCLLGISGGKDSCYVAYLARKALNLKALAVFYDFPFIKDLARDNARRVCDSLGIELVVVKTTNNLEYKLLRNHLISLAGTGTTWGQCIFCHYGISGALYRIAKERKIQTILSGTTSNETWWNPGRRTGFLMRRVKRLPLLDVANFALYQFKAYCGLAEQRRQFEIPGNKAYSPYSHPSPPPDGPQTIRVFDYLPWDQREIERVLTEETGWKKPDKKLTWRYDCILEPMLDFTYLREFGVSTVGLYLSGLIRDGLIDREEALKFRADAEDPEVLSENIRTVFDYLNLPKRVQDAYFRDGMPRGIM